jgi:phosphoenolpyruvate synthase/pyruvate phosphate dikinase
VLEDGEHTSSAGQNETFLGLKDDEEVIEGILQCWISLFSYQSVYYRV